ncbi:hypothetical protein H4R20_000563 [Coemansia guatemalensis]|uniref:Protein transport protein sec16 n=1 Tax=Coemansia guatemalensis TaxID=2761395 RepID=A0A9W8HYY7_9FUNG|nr:hypothetical protein H4R20_000563 [Coemansia guatemalensis]
MPQTPKADFATSPTRRGTPSTSEPIPYFSGGSNGATDADFFTLIGASSAADTNHTAHESVTADPLVQQQPGPAPVPLQYGYVSSEQQVDFGVPPRCATGPAVEYPHQSVAHQHEGPYVAAANFGAYRSASVVYGGAHYGAQQMYQTASMGMGSTYQVPNEASGASRVGAYGDTRDVTGVAEQQIDYSTVGTNVYDGYANASQHTAGMATGALAYTDINGDTTAGSATALAGSTAADTTNNGVVFDEAVGRYYDTNSGQYYDDVSGSWYYPQQDQDQPQQGQQETVEAPTSTYEVSQQAAQDGQGMHGGEWTNVSDGAAFFENLNGTTAELQQPNTDGRTGAAEALDTGHEIDRYGEQAAEPQVSSWDVPPAATEASYSESAYAAYADKGDTGLQPELPEQSQAAFYTGVTAPAPAPALSPSATTQIADEWAQYSNGEQALTSDSVAFADRNGDGSANVDVSMEAAANGVNSLSEQNFKPGFVPYEESSASSSFVPPVGEASVARSTAQGAQDVWLGNGHVNAREAYADMEVTGQSQLDGNENADRQSWDAEAKSALAGAAYRGMGIGAGVDAVGTTGPGMEYVGRQEPADEVHFGRSAWAADGYSTPDSMVGKQAAAAAQRRDGARVPVVAFGIGGRMVTMHPRVVTRFGADGNEAQRVAPGLLQVQALASVLAEKDAALPGLPLLTGEVTRTEVLRQRDTAVAWASALAEAPAVCALGAEEQALARVVVAVMRVAGERDIQGHSLSDAVDALRPLFAEVPRMAASSARADADDVQELEELLLAGRRGDAVSAASARGQWAHALVIASGAGRDAFAAAVAAFAATLHGGHTALGAQYGLFAGRGAAAVAAAHSDWARTLALALANRTPGDAVAMVRLGDGLRAAPLSAAHACYVAALQRDVFEGVTPRVVLLGAPRTSRCQLAVVLTELHELSLALRAVAAGDAPRCLPHLLPYKLLRAWWLADCGHITPASLYCEAALRLIAALPPAAAAPYSGALARELRALRERLAVTEPPARPAAASWLARAVPRPSLASLMTAVDSSIDRFIAGADTVPDTGSDAPLGSFEVGPDTARAPPAWGTMAGTSAVPDPPAWGDPGPAGPQFVSAAQGDLLVPAAAPGPAAASAWGYASAAAPSPGPAPVAAPPLPPPPAAEDEEEDMFGFVKRRPPASQSARPSADIARSAPVSTRASSDAPPAGAASKDPAVDKEPAGVFGMLKGLWASRKNQANLGEESQFVYDPALQRWVDKSAPAESQDSAPPPPPPPPPSAMRFQPHSAAPPASRPASALPAGFSGANGTALLPPAATSASANISRTATPMSSAAPDAAAPARAAKRRGARSRYVDLLNH